MARSRPGSDSPTSRARRGVLGALIAAVVVVGLVFVAASIIPAASGGAMSVFDAASSSGTYGLPLSKNPLDLPSQQLRAQRSSASPATVRLLSRIAKQPIADWYGGTWASVRTSVSHRVDAAAKQHGVAQLVVYNLPHRDCGLYSAAEISAGTYRSWFRTFVAGLGTHRAIVILEPDALLQLTAQCLTTAQQTERLALMRWAVGLLHRQGSWFYIDAGHAANVSAKTMAARLQRAGVAEATGFSLNVSGYRGTAETTAYGTKLSKLVGGKHFVIDTSRNGIAAAKNDWQWCNPTGRGLGHAPTAATGVALVDAYLWIKTPGASDGQCNGGPASGLWFQSEALALAKNARLG